MIFEWEAIVGAKKVHDTGQVIAFLHGDGKRYSVRFDMELVVRGSREPELDLARALLARGITGTAIVLDGSAGRPRTLINIERAALLSVEEGPNGARFVKRRQTCVARAQTGEMDTAGSPEPETNSGPLSEKAA